MCQSSRWLSMNLFSINKNKIVVEEGEKPLINFLEGELGFDVIGVPYRQVLEDSMRDQYQFRFSCRLIIHWTHAALEIRSEKMNWLLHHLVLPEQLPQVFEFGGSLHCSTWDVRRTGKCKDYFPNRDDIEDVGLNNLTDLP